MVRPCRLINHTITIVALFVPTALVMMTCVVMTVFIMVRSVAVMWFLRIAMYITAITMFVSSMPWMTTLRFVGPSFITDCLVTYTSVRFIPRPVLLVLVARSLNGIAYMRMSLIITRRVPTVRKMDILLLKIWSMFSLWCLPRLPIKFLWCNIIILRCLIIIVSVSLRHLKHRCVSKNCIIVLMLLIYLRILKK